MSAAQVRKYKRCKRYNIPGQAHELTFTCFQRFQLLNSDRSRTWLVESIGRARERYAFDLWAYVIMPEHVHLLMLPRGEEYIISRILTAIKWPVARKALEVVRNTSPAWAERLTDRQPNGRVDMRFWQRGGGYDRNVTKETTLHECLHYIHNNPVRRGLVEDPVEWHWSSARWYSGVRDGPLSIDETLPAVVFDAARKYVRG
jgi:putative transposase